MLAPNPDVESVLRAGAGHPRLAFLRGRWLWAIAAIALVILVGAWWTTQSGTAELTYLTQPVKRGDLTLTVTATGTVQPINQVDVGSELSGTVAAVNVDFNDKVTANQVLATINTDKLNAQTNHTRAQLEAARANSVVAQATVTETQRALTRAEALAKTNIIATQDLQSAQAAYDRAVASLDAANAQIKVSEADLASNESDLGKAEIRSPINGVVLNRAIDPGQTVAASLQAPVLFTLAEDLSKMNLLIDVDEADAGSVKEGQDASFTVEAFPDTRYTAKVVQLRYAPETVNGVVTYKAVLSADNATLTLRPGMTATADVVIRETKDALLVPNAGLRYAPPATEISRNRNRSIFSRLFPSPQSEARPTRPAPNANGERRIYVLRNGVPTPVTITTGDSDGTFTVVKSGDLREGDAVIADSTAAK